MVRVFASRLHPAARQLQRKSQNSKKDTHHQRFRSCSGARVGGASHLWGLESVSCCRGLVRGVIRDAVLGFALERMCSLTSNAERAKMR